jgi:OHCU decarboxylase
MAEDYPRDLVGYGRTPPQAAWPGAARLAVQFVLNYEEGGENSILHGDAASEAFLSEIAGATPWPGRRHLNMESLYEYGSRAGFWRLWRMFTERAMPVTVFGVATALARHPEAVAAMREARWEIASHGLKWIDYKDVPEAVERAHIRAAMELHEKVTGETPAGFYQGRVSRHTIPLLMEEPDILYLSDSYADELPYWVEGPHGPRLMVPYALDSNDMGFTTAQGFTGGEDFFAYLRDAFDVLYAEGAATPKMLSIGLHCRIVGRPGRAAALARFLDYVARHDGVWVATRLDIARHWVRRFPHKDAARPSQMHRALFVATFGDVYEHTPAVAEAAHRAGLTTAQDSAEGLHQAMETAMLALDEKAKLALLRAHPDLAGKLAQAKLLTADSSNEQAGAGLDHLTPDELARFTALNDAYKAKFGFPFIVSVAGKKKPEILAAFETRLAHDRPTEFATALDQVARIALMRLRARLPS